MAVKEKIKSHPNVVDYFKGLPFYKKQIKKPRVKPLKNFDLLSEHPFYEELNVIKTNYAFRGYAISYKVELVEKKKKKRKKKASKSSINNLFNDLLNGRKGFMYQITVNILLKKYKSNGETKFAPIYFKLTTKTVKNHKFNLENAFQEILYRTDNWINEGSGWVVELNNILTFQLLDHYQEVLMYN